MHLSVPILLIFNDSHELKSLPKIKYCLPLIDGVVLVRLLTHDDIFLDYSVQLFAEIKN